MNTALLFLSKKPAKKPFLRGPGMRSFALVSPAFFPEKLYSIAGRPAIKSQTSLFLLCRISTEPMKSPGVPFPKGDRDNSPLWKKKGIEITPPFVKKGGWGGFFMVPCII
ncbi:MAG: hypothetical protein C4530_21690 [Desulfobacteraceae bacterium]|nr:MAG: hypothetical protein C4530_21690 [Desulfobacteraceae bacterium]